MKLFNGQKLESLDDLLIEQLEDIRDAEQRLVEALPHMADAAGDPQLRDAFRHHLEETRHHVERLDQAFQMLSREPGSSTCDAMKGLVEEARDMVDAEGAAAVKDAALIAAAQRVEHDEIAAYGTVRSLARRLGRDDVASLLQTTLDEEHAADDTLNRLAESTVNPAAARA